MKKNPRYRRPPTSESMAKAALGYLSRFAASETSLRRVLENRIRRFCLHNQAFAQDKDAQAALHLIIDTIIARHKKTGALNDAAYAEIKINSLRRAGRSARVITQKLGRAGVKKDVIHNALAGEEGGVSLENAEINAARELARRRKLGSFRKGISDPSRHRKDLAVLARAGFTLSIARQVLDDQGDGDEN